MHGNGAVLIKVLPAVPLEILPRDSPERSEEETPGDIAVVILDGQDATIKKILWTDEHHATLIPQSTNPVHQPVSVDIRRTPLVINGVAVKVEVSL